VINDYLLGFTATAFVGLPKLWSNYKVDTRPPQWRNQ